MRPSTGAMWPERAKLRTTRAAAALALVLVAGSAGCTSRSDAAAEEATPPDAGGSARGGSGGASGGDGGAHARRCNGRVDLCERPYDRVVFPGAHNAHAALEYGYAGIGNQRSGLPQQLADGVRVFLLDVYPSDSGEVIFCHSVCSIASTPHAEWLATLGAFFGEHPDEVVTIIYEDHVDPAVLAGDIEAAGLAGEAFQRQPGAPWPTLAEMIDAGTRLVVTAESAGPPPAWLHHVWDLAFDTPYTFTSIDAFNCDLNRGSPDNDLLLVNHWVSQDNTLPSEADAPAANAFDVLYGRAAGCAQQTGHVPNFLAVDFYEDGELFAVVDALNDDVAAGAL